METGVAGTYRGNLKAAGINQSKHILSIKVE